MDATGGILGREASVELRGTPGETFAGHITFLRYVSGLYVQETNIVSGQFDQNGILVVDVIDGSSPTFTIVLSTEFFAIEGDIVGLDGDGNIADISIFGTVLDTVGIPLAAGTEESRRKGSSLGGTDFRFIPGIYLVFRDSCFGQLYAATKTGKIQDINQVEYSTSAFNSSDDLFFGTRGSVNPGFLPTTV